MKFTLPILAVIVAAILVASQSLFTVHQTQFAIKFQLGEVVEVITDPGLHYKVPLVQNVKYFDQRNLTLEIQEPDRVTTAGKKPLL
ncbi:MAG TPA: SPFH domain-containing protein, partial [Casimicrobiaceae bacterium]|nr:SPFH domain-containing protein [Casimicrobiaceae bacterium]